MFERYGKSMNKGGYGFKGKYKLLHCNYWLTDMGLGSTLDLMACCQFCHHLGYGECGATVRRIYGDAYVVCCGISKICLKDGKHSESAKVTNNAV